MFLWIPPVSFRCPEMKATEVQFLRLILDLCSFYFRIYNETGEVQRNTHCITPVRNFNTLKNDHQRYFEHFLTFAVIREERIKKVGEKKMILSRSGQLIYFFSFCTKLCDHSALFVPPTKRTGKKTFNIKACQYRYKSRSYL